MNCDKGLGVAIIKTICYIHRAIDEHLSDLTTYQRISPLMVTMAAGQLKQLIKKWITKYKDILSPMETKFLKKTLEANKEPFGFFYLLPKLHKTPICTRPVISGSGSLLHPLGTWVDSKLQQVAKLQRSYFRDSKWLKNHLLSLRLPPNARLFTADATAMYTNIPTEKALRMIGDYLRNNANLFSNIPINALMEALKIIMRCNYFNFGDVVYKQKTGRAIGAPPAPPWATTF